MIPSTGIDVALTIVKAIHTNSTALITLVDNSKTDAIASASILGFSKFDIDILL